MHVLDYPEGSDSVKIHHHIRCSYKILFPGGARADVSMCVSGFHLVKLSKVNALNGVIETRWLIFVLR